MVAVGAAAAGQLPPYFNVNDKHVALSSSLCC